MRRMRWAKPGARRAAAWRRSWSQASCSVFMVRLIMFPEMFASTMQASFHGGDTGAEGFGDFRMTAAFLDKREQDPILRAELREGVPQRVELLRAHGATWLGHIFVLRRERQKDA